MQDNRQRALRRIVVATAVVTISGALGLSYFAKLSLADALYETLIILLSHDTRHNYTDPFSRTIIILLIISSLVLVAYLLKWFAEYMIGIGSNVRKQRVNAKVSKLKNHYIVCGLGRVGSQVAREMDHENVPFVVFDRDQEKVDEALAEGYLAVCADSTAEGVLVDAGIEKAQGLVASLGEDAQNLFVTLAARSLNPSLYIVARANRQENELKLKRAGADRVALPYQIGGYHMASMALRPNVVDYMDVISAKKGGNDLEVEEMVVGEASHLAGHRLGKTLAEGEVGATVIAINGADGRSQVRPNGQEVIYPGDRLIILGSKKDLTTASALIR
jgi:voltage-gated potassium channel